jgi:hypothetical protein
MRAEAQKKRFHSILHTLIFGPQREGPLTGPKSGSQLDNTTYSKHSTFQPIKRHYRVPISGEVKIYCNNNVAMFQVHRIPGIPPLSFISWHAPRCDLFIFSPSPVPRPINTHPQWYAFQSFHLNLKNLRTSWTRKSLRIPATARTRQSTDKEKAEVKFKFKDKDED